MVDPGNLQGLQEGQVGLEDLEGQVGNSGTHQGVLVGLVDSSGIPLVDQVDQVVRSEGRLVGHSVGHLVDREVLGGSSGVPRPAGMGAPGYTDHHRGGSEVGVVTGSGRLAVAPTHMVGLHTSALGAVVGAGTLVCWVSEQSQGSRRVVWH